MSGGKRPSVGVMLVNFGVPDAPTEQAVSTFLRSYMTDVRVFGRTRLFLYHVTHMSLFRGMAAEAAQRYADICTDDGFPYLKIGARQAKLVADGLARKGIEGAAVVTAYRYGNPGMRKGFAHLAKLGCRRILVVPLYPQSSYSFTATVHDEYKKAKKHYDDLEFRFVDNYYDNRIYVRTMANAISHAFKPKSTGSWDAVSASGSSGGSGQIPAVVPQGQAEGGLPDDATIAISSLDLDTSIPDIEERDAKVVFAFRSIPLKDVSRGDTYELQTSATALAIADELGLTRERWTIAYMPYKHMGEHPMLSPDIDETVARFVAGDVRDVVVACPGITTDSVDTTLEIDRDMREKFESAFAAKGKSCSFSYVPALNAGRSFAHMMTEIVYENLRGWDDLSDGHDDLYGIRRTMRRTDEDPRPDVFEVPSPVPPAALDIEMPVAGEIGADGRIDPESLPGLHNTGEFHAIPTIDHGSHEQ